jgi:CRP-like cAMP-binding protein
MSSAVMSDFRSIGIFAALSDSVLERIIKESYCQTFPAEVTLFWQGKTVDFVHGVVNGFVELSAYHNSNHYTMLIAGPGSVTPMHSFVGDSACMCTARTVNKARITMTPVHVVRELLSSEPDFARAVLHETVRMNRTLVRELHNRNLRKSHERLAHWIYEQVSQGPDTQDVELAFHKRLLASSLGMSLATLARDIEVLEPYGVSFEGRKIHVRSVRELAEVAHPSPHFAI